jgi:protein-tyrosine-phosphatase
VIVGTAGVLSHEGEGAASEAQMALMQFGIDISQHRSRSLHAADQRNAEVLLAVDRGTEVVLQTEFPHDPRVACLSTLAAAPDVIDPHRMPLGVWIAATRQLQEQVSQALLALRQRLGTSTTEPWIPPTEQPSVAPLSSAAPQISDNSPSMPWASDAEMQRLIGLINSAPPDGAAPSSLIEPDDAEVSATFSAGYDEPPAAVFEPITMQPATPQPAQELSSRAAQVARMVQFVAAAEDMPEIIDWQRLRQELVQRLRGLAAQPVGPLDYVPAAALMLEGKLGQHASLPPAAALARLHATLARLATTLDAPDLALIGAELAQW